LLCPTSVNGKCCTAASGPGPPRGRARNGRQWPPLLSRLPWLMRPRVPALPWLAGIRLSAACNSSARRAASVDWNPSLPTWLPWATGASHGLGCRAASCLASSSLRVLRSACLGVTFLAADLRGVLLAAFLTAFFAAFLAAFLA